MSTSQMWITLGLAALFAGAAIVMWLIVDRRKRNAHVARCPACKHAVYAHGVRGCTAQVALPGGPVRCACKLANGIAR